MGEDQGTIKTRNSKDKKSNREGRRLVEMLEETGWSILNGNIKGDEDGEYTYTGSRGNTVIDYILGNEGLRERIERLETGEDNDSDHHPVIRWMREEGKWEKGKSTRQGSKRGIWNEKGREKFRKEIGGTNIGGNEREVGEEVEKMNERIKKALEGYGKGDNKRERRRQGWWDKEYAEEKEKVRQKLRRWRKGEEGGERYREEKRKYREMCKRKKKEEGERLIREAGEARTGSKVWEIVNRERRKTK